MSETAIRDAVVAEHLRGLKMPGAAKEYQSLSRQARDGAWPYKEFLRQVLEAEMRSRQERTAARRLQEAHFPDIKTLDQLDWDALKGVSRTRLLELASCAYLNRAEARDRMKDIPLSRCVCLNGRITAISNWGAK